MDKNKRCSRMHCIIKYRFELIGLVLIGLATTLTMVSMDSLGIVAMFIIGALLCCHQYCFKTCSANVSQDAENTAPKKPVRPRRKPRKSTSETEKSEAKKE